jgi:hypothetical protein
MLEALGGDLALSGNATDGVARVEVGEFAGAVIVHENRWTEIDVVVPAVASVDLTGRCCTNRTAPRPAA